MFKVLSLCQRLWACSHVREWLLLTFIAVLVFSKVTSTKSATLATVDVTGIVQQFVRSQATLNLPPKVLEQRVNAFGHQMEATLKSLAQERHLLLLPQEAVISGAVDVTSVVKERLPTHHTDTMWYENRPNKE
jgi:hypothetical protein